MSGNYLPRPGRLRLTDGDYRTIQEMFAPVKANLRQIDKLHDANGVNVVAIEQRLAELIGVRGLIMSDDDGCRHSPTGFHFVDPNGEARCLFCGNRVDVR